ncbi:hypothetical protein FIBSPDRAFT_968482 [Athelia psychrophila]|uniref:Extracellular membrane protein CFEM domain-containing protein n=1 Tax=Athelia psychrophila TaxID=1759441 RepID=A0A167UKI1_9AGAM|nr:hypothetical protein FIBSPDRAFT_968482 [Fibularhizoctonia sp. CBS 109695]
MHSFIVYTLFFLSLLAGRALALNITLAAPVGLIPASQFLAFPASALTASCDASCTPATAAITTCGDADDACLCDADTVAAVLACEQCLFAALIDANVVPPDLRVGQTSALAAYSAACLASPSNITLPVASIALTLPAGWNGPVSQQLGVPATVLTLMVGVMLGVGAVGMVCTM